MSFTITVVDNITTLGITEEPVVISEQIAGIAGPAGQGVPSGGTTGQVLAKNSNTSYDTEWIDAGAGSGTVTNVTGTSPINVATGTTTPVVSIDQTALTITESQVTNLVSDLAAKIPSTEKGANSGVATLDSSGKIPTTQLPPLAVNDTFVVASQAAMLALTAQVGDIAVRTDVTKTFILTASPASTLGNWQEILTPPGVTSITASSPLTGGTITSTGSIGLDQTALSITSNQVSDATTTGAASKLVKTDSSGNITAGTGGVTSSGQIQAKTTSTSAPAVIVSPQGTIATTSITTATASGPTSIGYGVASATGFVVGQTVQVTGVTGGTNLNGTFTVSYVQASPAAISVTTSGGQSGSGTGGTITAFTTANLQEWQNPNGTAVASVSGVGALTASGLSISGKTITVSGNTTIGSSTNTVNLTTTGNTSVTLPTSGILVGSNDSKTVTSGMLADYVTAPDLWYSPSGNISLNNGNNFTANTGYDVFNLTNGVTVATSTTYVVEGYIEGTITNGASTSTPVRFGFDGNGLSSLGMWAQLQYSFSTGGNMQGTYINNQTLNTQISSSVPTAATSINFALRFAGTIKTNTTSPGYFQPKMSLTTVNSSTVVVNSKSFVSLKAIAGTSTTSKGTWS